MKKSTLGEFAIRSRHDYSYSMSPSLFTDDARRTTDRQPFSSYPENDHSSLFGEPVPPTVRFLDTLDSQLYSFANRNQPNHQPRLQSASPKLIHRPLSSNSFMTSNQRQSSTESSTTPEAGAYEDCSSQVQNLSARIQQCEQNSQSSSDSDKPKSLPDSTGIRGVSYFVDINSSSSQSDSKVPRPQSSSVSSSNYFRRPIKSKIHPVIDKITEESSSTSSAELVKSHSHPEQPYNLNSHNYFNMEYPSSPYRSDPNLNKRKSSVFKYNIKCFHDGAKSLDDETSSVSTEDNMGSELLKMFASPVKKKRFDGNAETIDLTGSLDTQLDRFIPLINEPIDNRNNVQEIRSPSPAIVKDRIITDSMFRPESPIRTHRETAFAVLNELQVPRLQSAQSSTSGRVSPFRGRGFRPSPISSARNRQRSLDDTKKMARRKTSKDNTLNFMKNSDNFLYHPSQLDTSCASYGYGVKRKIKSGSQIRSSFSKSTNDLLSPREFQNYLKGNPTHNQPGLLKVVYGADGKKKQPKYRRRSSLEYDSMERLKRSIKMKRSEVDRDDLKGLIDSNAFAKENFLRAPRASHILKPTTLSPIIGTPNRESDISMAEDDSQLIDLGYSPKKNKPENVDDEETLITNSSQDPSSSDVTHHLPIHLPSKPPPPIQHVTNVKITPAKKPQRAVRAKSDLSTDVVRNYAANRSKTRLNISRPTKEIEKKSSSLNNLSNTKRSTPQLNRTVRRPVVTKPRSELVSKPPVKARDEKVKNKEIKPKTSTVKKISKKLKKTFSSNSLESNSKVPYREKEKSKIDRKPPIPTKGKLSNLLKGKKSDSIKKPTNSEKVKNSNPSDNSNSTKTNSKPPLKRENTSSSFKREKSSITKTKSEASLSKPKAPVLSKHKTDNILNKTKIDEAKIIHESEEVTNESSAIAISGGKTEESPDNVNGHNEKLIPLTKSNVVSMTTAAITTQPLEITTVVTNQIGQLDTKLAEHSDDNNLLTDPTKIIEKSQKTLESIQRTVNEATEEISKTIEENLTDLKTIESNIGRSTPTTTASLPRMESNKSLLSKAGDGKTLGVLSAKPSSSSLLTTVGMENATMSLKGSPAKMSVMEQATTLSTFSGDKTSEHMQQTNSSLMESDSLNRIETISERVEKSSMSHKSDPHTTSMAASNGNSAANETMQGTDGQMSNKKSSKCRMCCLNCWSCRCCRRNRSNSVSEVSSLSKSKMSMTDVEKGEKPSLCRRLFCCCVCSKCCDKTKSKKDTVTKDTATEKTPGCCSRLMCCGKKKPNQTVEKMSKSPTASSKKSSCWPCCKRKTAAGTSEVASHAWQENERRRESTRSTIGSSEVKQGCCARMCSKIFCCCRKKQDAESRRTSMNSKKASIAPTIPPEDNSPKLAMSLVEHTSLMKAAIPVMPVPVAWTCLILNCIIPGLGTIFSGMICLCFGIPRFSQRDGAKQRIGAFVIDLVVGVAQAFCLLFCLVGYGWSVWWGVIMLKVARKHKKFKDAEQFELDDTATSANTAQNVRQSARNP